MIAGLGFCMTKFFDFALINLFSDSFAKERGRIVLQSLDFIWILSVMWYCRARKEWPPYFTLSINELPGMDASNNASASLPASLTAFVSDKFLLNDNDDDDKKSVGSIGSDELVCIVNPNNYTLEYDDFADGTVEVSAFDPDVIVEETENNALWQSREDLKRGVQDGSHSI